jgi:UDP-N-acetylglucosamine:LPS N-acetylglucosamine transferase
MPQKGFIVVTDRGGHLHDALRLIDQMRTVPQAVVTTVGPDVDYLKHSRELPGAEIVSFPQFFSWWGKIRFWNPLKFIYQIVLSFFSAIRLRPRVVISLGAANVIPFCYFSKMLGARIYHVENLAQVVSKSTTGKMLYPICSELYVQWEELLPLYGAKASYRGWVL